MKTSLPARVCALVGLLLLVGACGMSQARYGRMVEEAGECEPGDTCVLAGRGECVCDRPVNARHAERVNGGARWVSCSAYPKCISYSAPRCENGRCVATPSW